MVPNDQMQPCYDCAQPCLECFGIGHNPCENQLCKDGKIPLPFNINFQTEAETGKCKTCLNARVMVPDGYIACRNTDHGR